MAMTGRGPVLGGGRAQKLGRGLDAGWMWAGAEHLLSFYDIPQCDFGWDQSYERPPQSVWSTIGYLGSCWIAYIIDRKGIRSHH